MSKPRTEEGKRRTVSHWKVIAALLSLYDVITVNLAYYLALWVRFDFHASIISAGYLENWLRFIPIYTAVCLLAFWVLKLYRSIWRFASFAEFTRVAAATALTGALHALLITLLFGKMPVAYYLLGPVFQFIFTLAIRFSYRLVLLLRAVRQQESGKLTRVMLIGAGSAGQMLLRDVMKEEEAEVVCIIDDNPNKWNREIDGVPVVGGRHEILSAVEKYRVNKIFLAIPSASAEQRKDILDICKETGCELKNLPGMMQLVRGEVSVSNLRDVSVEDLLGRDPIRMDMSGVQSFLRGKTVLVTGGGGSIGSELCRQIATYQPKKLIILDTYENSAYDIQLELLDRHPELDLLVLIGSVRDSRRLDEIFTAYHPEVVYHAAAHKHVPLMEVNPCEAIKNNSIGTYKTAYAAMKHGAQRFVLISTDKAVNPTNIMGASKRLCEMIIQSFDAKIKAGRAEEIPMLFTHSDLNQGMQAHEMALSGPAKTEFVAVRFGNVLGSNGSVIPVFRRQIAEGGPVTVTHPDIIRYFMTIPEAVSLVLQAGTYAHGGEIFVLDMGSPVKIDTLARNLIRLSGLKPGVDIQIEYTGLRPGEKLYEEKLMAEEGLRKTDNELIHIGMPIPFDTDEFLTRLEGLMQAAYSNRPDIRDLVREMVSTYHPEGTEAEDEESRSAAG